MSRVVDSLGFDRPIHMHRAAPRTSWEQARAVALGLAWLPILGVAPLIGLVGLYWGLDVALAGSAGAVLVGVASWIAAGRFFVSPSRSVRAHLVALVGATLARWTVLAVGLLWLLRDSGLPALPVLVGLLAALLMQILMTGWMR